VNCHSIYRSTFNSRQQSEMTSDRAPAKTTVLVLGMRRSGTSCVTGVRQGAGVGQDCFRSYPTPSKFTSHTLRSSASTTKILTVLDRPGATRALYSRDQTVIRGSLPLRRRRLKDVIHQTVSGSVSHKDRAPVYMSRPTCCCRRRRKRNIRGKSFGMSDV
jgi:hypothetical protein